HFGEASEIDGALDGRLVGDARAAHLDVVLGRDHDLGVEVDALVVAAELGAPFGEDDLVFLRLDQGRLVGGGPDLAAVDVAHVAEIAPVVGGRVFAPAVDREVLPAAVAAA